MNINRIRESLSTSVKTFRYNRQMKSLNNLVNISEVTDSDVYNQLYSARECLANYAKANKVRLAFSSSNENNAKLPLKVVVKKAKSEQILNSGFVDTDVNKTSILYLHNSSPVLHNASFEDTYLRRVYRAVAGLINPFNK